MVCPVAPLLALGAVLGGAHTVLIQDRTRRHAAWIVVLALCAGWAGYATAFRLAPLRVALEAATVLALAAAGARAWWLARHRGLRSPLLARLSPLGRLLWGCLLSPWVLVVNTLLLTMLTLQWLDRARFNGAEYTVVSLALAAAIAVQASSAARARRAARRMSALESFAAPTAASCPLGFGHAASPFPSTRAGDDGPARGWPAGPAHEPGHEGPSLG